MYLSRLLLNPRSRQAQRETADPYQLHKTVLSAFADNRESSGVLHRLDIHPRTGRITLLVQSRLAPDWRLPDGYLLPVDPFDGPDNPAVKAVELSLSAGQILNFRLLANPTIKKARHDEGGERRNSNRVPLVHEEQQLEWLAHKAGQSGFKVLHVNAGGGYERKGWKGKDKPPLTLYLVQFDGRLQITDAALFQSALAHGIGPARAFGCGLLSLAPT